MLLTRIGILNNPTSEPKKFVVLASSEDTVGIFHRRKFIDQLCENISQTYSMVFPEEPIIKVMQIKYNDYVIPSQYVFFGKHIFAKRHCQKYS